MLNLPKNELRPETLATASLNSWISQDTASRVQMFGGHMSQALVLKGADIRRQQSGTEREFGRATFKVKMPCNGEVVAVIDKYPASLFRSSRSPLIVIIYRDIDTDQFGHIEVPRHHCLHTSFGFEYKYNTQILRKLVQGMVIRKDTVLADSPSIDEAGNYNYGVEVKTAMMSLPGIIEDGVIISKSLAARMETLGIESRVASWGKNYYPLNLYGDAQTYKPFPDIGQRIRPDGLLFALRRLSPNEPEDFLMAPVDMMPEALKAPEYLFDKVVWAEPNALVTDINVHHNIRNNNEPTPPLMAAQARQYYVVLQQFHSRIVEEYDKLVRARGEQNVKLTEELDHLITTSLYFNGSPDRLKAVQLFRRIPLDDWRVEVTFEHSIIPDEGFKLTDSHGNKGVVCSVREDEDMPFDPVTGERADLIMDPFSRIKRMNTGGLYEQYVNASAAQLSRKIVEMTNTQDPSSWQAAWEMLVDFYGIVSPRMRDRLLSPSYKGTPREHVEAVRANGIYLWIPTDNEAEGPHIIQQLREKYPAAYNPVLYRGVSGKMVMTESPVIIGSLYIILLEKTGNDWMGVSSAKLQHFGIPAKMTQQDRYAMPGRVNPVRNFGESEVRSGVAVTEEGTIPKLMEMSNNPVVHKHVCRKILQAEKPGNIECVWDYSELPEGGNRSLGYVLHMLQCGGIDLYEKPGNVEDGAIYHSENPDINDNEFDVGDGDE